MRSRSRWWMPLAAIIGCASWAGAAEYTLSFEERDRFEGLAEKYPQGGGAELLQVWVSEKKVYETDVFLTGQLWHETVRFAVEDPRRVRLAFRLEQKDVADPEIELGNIRVRDARAGEVVMVGKWTPVRTGHGFLLHSWSFAPEPAFRDGFALRRAYGTPVKEAGPHAEWRFEGRLEPIANLQVRRLFEYVGCYDELSFYDDWKNVTFSPPRPKAGEAVAITAKVRNAGSLDATRATVSLSVDGKLVATKVVDVPAVSDVQVPFVWTATEGFHCFVVRADPQNAIRETRKDDNWLLRALVVGDVQKAHPYLFFRASDVPKLEARLANPPAWYARYYGETKAGATWLHPEDEQRFEETSAIVAAHNAFLALVEPDFRPLDAQKQPVTHTTRQRATAFLKTIWDFPRGHFSDAACAIAHYAQAYDWMAPALSPEDDREVRARLAKTVAERVTHLRTRGALVKGKSFYPGETYKMAYSQGTYIDACAIVLGALALAGEPGADEWLHFGLNAIDEEILREMTTPHGYYREGHGYMSMAENRSGTACWLALAHIGANPSEFYPLVERMHELFLRDRMPNGWCPPINDNRVDGFPQILYAPLYRNPATRAAARWDWQTQIHTPRGVIPDGHWGNMFLLTDTPESDKEPAAPPPWTPTQFLGDYLVFRSDWSPDAAYLCLNTKHFPSSSHSHDQSDKNSFLLYAKRAFLAIDPGYGNTAGRALINTVTAWCRGGDNPFNHNMIVVDCQRPAKMHRSPYVYPCSPFPENTFATDFFDFGEAVLKEWDYRDHKRGHRLCVINHRRSVLFPHLSDSPAQHYFVLIDDLESVTDNTHTYEFILNGNCRHPCRDADHLGDFRASPPRAEDVPLADNLVIETARGGLEARWLVENADGKDVVLRAFLAAPSPEQMTTAAGDGWLGYARPVARNKYLDAKVEGVRNVRFLTVLYPDLVGDASDDVRIERIGDSARLTFKDGTVHVIAMKGEAQRAEAEMAATDAEIAFWELSDTRKLHACVLIRGSSFGLGGTVVKTSAIVDSLALDVRSPREVRGYLSAEKPVTVSLWLGATCEEALFAGNRVAATHEAGAVVLRGLQGAGPLVLTMRD